MLDFDRDVAIPIGANFGASMDIEADGFIRNPTGGSISSGNLGINTTPGLPAARDEIIYDATPVSIVDAATGQAVAPFTAPITVL